MAIKYEDLRAELHRLLRCENDDDLLDQLNFLFKKCDEVEDRDYRIRIESPQYGTFIIEKR